VFVAAGMVLELGQRPGIPLRVDDGQPDLPSGGHAELPSGGQLDYLV
jgi:hypothetical protein